MTTPDLSLVATTDLIRELTARCPYLFLAAETPDASEYANTVAPTNQQGQGIQLVCNADQAKVHQCMLMVGAGIRVTAQSLSPDPLFLTSLLTAVVVAATAPDEGTSIQDNPLN